METADILAPKNGMTPLPEIPRKKDQVQNQSAAITDQEGICSLPSADQTPRTRKVIRQGKGGACIWSGKGAVRLSKNTIPRSGETDGKIEYIVCSGKSHSD